MMFFGNYEHSLDDKGRLLLPRKIKEVLGDCPLLYVLKGFDGCLAVYSENDFQKLIEEVEKISFNKKNSRDYLRIMLGSVVELNVDKVGRIQLPSQTLNKYHINKNVIIIGVGDHFEIWDKVSYEEYEKVTNENFENIAENLNNDE